VLHISGWYDDEQIGTPLNFRGMVAKGATPDGEPADAYTYDPIRPVPFLTEPVSDQIGGPDDYAAIQRRDDVLVYVTPPLAEELEITGPINLELYAASSALDTDFMAMLLEVHPTGFAQRIYHDADHPSHLVCRLFYGAGEELGYLTWREEAHGLTNDHQDEDDSVAGVDSYDD
jgi:predicted acyl esterase